MPRKLLTPLEQAAGGRFRTFIMFWRIVIRTSPTMAYRMVLSAPRNWFLMGGSVERHPQHHTVWTGVTGLFGAIWAGLVFATNSETWHVLGWLSLFVAAYILTTFFLPLPLIPIRDERKVALRRIENERQLQLTVAALREAVAQVEPAPQGSPLSIAQGLINRGSELLMAEYEAGGLGTEARSSKDVGAANAWLRDCRAGMAAHFAEQLYRVAAPLAPDASGVSVVAALNQTMPALQNFRNQYSKRGA